MINVIDHKQREKMGLTTIQYLVCDACAKMHTVLGKTSDLADTIGLPKSTVTLAINDMISAQPAVLYRHENGSAYPTEYWYISHMFEPEEVLTGRESLALSVMEFFNKTNGTSYSTKTNVPLIVNILKANPKLDARHFEAVVSHKYETWGSDAKMKEYNRPSTLFSSKFMRYLDDAIIYYSNKQK